MEQPCLYHTWYSKSLTHWHLFLQEKCAQYWPSDGLVSYGDITVELKKEEECESYTVRDLLVTNTRVGWLVGGAFPLGKARVPVPVWSHFLQRRTRAGRSGSSTSMAGLKWASPAMERAWSTSSPPCRSSSSNRGTIPSPCTAGTTRPSPQKGERK